MPTLSEKEIVNIKACGKILSSALRIVSESLKPGITAEYLNNIAEKELRNSGARPSFLNYGAHSGRPFPASLCVSINEEVVHGIPGKQKIIHQGDIVSLDLGAQYLGVCTDMAVSIIVGKPKNDLDKKLVNTAKEALNIGIKFACAGNHTGDIGYSIQRYAESRGFSVIRALVGHGIGKDPHQEPQVPNFGNKGEGSILLPNTAIAIEPMISYGSHEVKTQKDGWTVVTADGKRSAHFEHTVLITRAKPIVVTQ